MSKLDQLKALGDAKRAARKSFDGGVESRHAPLANASMEAGPVHGGSQRTRAGIAPGPSETKSEGGKVKLQAREKVSQDHGSPAKGHSGEGQGSTTALVAARSKRGRPRIGEPKVPRAEPWKALGMSERTWWRRLSEQREGKK